MSDRRTYRIADLFCGAGGSSTGAIKAIRSLGGDVDLVAVNHWDIAIATHSRNHPNARHYCVSLDAARPEELVPDGKLDLLMASPECVFFSRARGGKPVNDQRRMSAWHVQRWASTLDVRCILIENVPEFRDWGPLLSDDRPDPDKKGQYFQAWVQALWGMGYDVDWKLLNAANYGGATTRTRFFLQARKDGQPIRWPEPSHSASGKSDMFGRRPKWRSARDIIDWSNAGGSLLDRKRPLSLKTRLRIARGLRKFGGELAPLYIRLLDLPSDVEQDLIADCNVGRPTPFIFANRNNATPKGADEPIPTATTTTGGGMCLVAPKVEPFILGQQSNSIPRSTDGPIPTVATAGAISLIQPMLTSYYGSCESSQSVDVPLPTVTTRDRFGLVSPLVVPYGPRAEARSAEEPLPTVLTRDRLGVAVPTIDPFIVPNFGEREGQAPRIHAIGDPLPCVTGHGAGALVDPTIVKANCTAPDPRRLVTVGGALWLLDIRFRMLTNRELARAMGFDGDGHEYEFTGTVSDVTKQIGNAVEVHTAEALVLSILDESATRHGEVTAG